MKANCEIRRTARERGVKHWRIALFLGIGEQTLMRWLRTPLSEERKKAILCAIDELSKEER